MDLLKIDRSSKYIEMRKMGGVDKDVDALIVHSITPRLGQRVGSGKVLIRPPTKLVVLVDREGKFREQDSREKKRARWAELIAAEVLTRDGARVDHAAIMSLIQLMIWDEFEASFEFANFSDKEITDAVMAICRESRSVPRASVSTAVHGMRMNQRNGSGTTDLSKLLHHEYGIRLNKTRLADALWPSLRRRILEAKLQDNFDAIPVAKALREVEMLADGVLRTDVMIMIDMAVLL